MRTTHMRHRRAVIMGAVALGANVRRAAAQAVSNDDPWPSLARQIFDGRHLEDGSAMIGIDAPYRAEDAAVVPISIQVIRPLTTMSAVNRITLVIDQNPSPVAAIFTLGRAVGSILFQHVSVWIPIPISMRLVRRRMDCSTTQNASSRLPADVRRRRPSRSDSIPLGTMRFQRSAPKSANPRVTDHGPASKLFRDADGSGIAALCAGAIRVIHIHLAGRRSVDPASTVASPSRKTRRFASTIVQTAHIEFRAESATARDTYSSNPGPPSPPDNVRTSDFCFCLSLFKIANHVVGQPGPEHLP